MIRFGVFGLLTSKTQLKTRNTKSEIPDGGAFGFDV